MNTTRILAVAVLMVASGLALHAARDPERLRGVGLELEARIAAFDAHFRRREHGKSDV